MPNYTKLEEQLLGAAERDLTTQSRQPELGALDDGGVYRLIADLTTAQAAADAAPKADGRSAADILAAALRRAHAERRKRGLKPKAADADKPVAKAAAKPALIGKPAVPRAPASPARKPAGRAKAEARKNDLRTGSHRVTKRRAKADAATDATPTPSVVAPAATAQVAEPAPVAGKEPSTKKLAKQAALKAAAKAAKAAEKDARKIARKVAKDAEKAARKAAKKAVKDADKAAKKAARKAEKASAKAMPDTPDA